MADVKYLDTTGLTYFWGKIKEQLNQKQDTITNSNKLSASLISGLANVATSGSYADLNNKPDGADIYYDNENTVAGSIKKVVDALIANKQNILDKGSEDIYVKTLRLGASGNSATHIATSFTDEMSPDIQGTSLTTAGSVISYVGAKIRSLGVLSYKGTKTTYSDLPTNASKGDVYNVTNAYDKYPAGTNYAWDGTAWDALGGAIDLSSYQLKSELVAITNTEIDGILTA